uniref:Putative homing endonuclease n=1 Tax=viral metagenome TaxID=1070528 RepID=A0A6M3J879_9ZZZZ
MDKNALEAARRYRARRRGEDVPKRQPGPKPGYQQTAEHAEKRKRWGADHHAWMGENVSEKGGRSRATRRYPDIGPCWLCGSEPAERHHIDGDTANNSPSNIAIVCRKCHMASDGRLDEFRELARRNQPKAIAARWR